ncbi:hypothetical protein [Demequina gelatinilytica]|uniref:hypothetical protein n=1 Tax=Demequina gelatinilytica TaxID=1638980 RepID=UPI0007817157|nr:hypothetical protein [Demequina gelatinilytica]
MLSADTGLVLASGAGLIAVEVARSVPAWLRVRRSHRVDGLSAVSLGVLLGSVPAWLAVAVLAQAWGVLVATLVWAVFHARLCREASLLDATFRSVMPRAAGATLAGLALIGVVGESIGALRMSVGLALVAVTAAYSIPALWSGLRAADVSGISITATAVSAVEGVIYVVVGMGWTGTVVVPSYLAFGALAIASNVPRCWRAIAQRARDARRERTEPLGLGFEA